MSAALCACRAKRAETVPIPHFLQLEFVKDLGTLPAVRGAQRPSQCPERAALVPTSVCPQLVVTTN